MEVCKKYVNTRNYNCISHDLDPWDLENVFVGSLTGGSTLGFYPNNTPEQSSLYYSCRLQNKAILLTFLNIISSVGAQFKRTETPDWRLSLVYPLYSRCYEMQTFGLVSSCSIGSVNLYLLS